MILLEYLFSGKDLREYIGMIDLFEGPTKF